MPRIISALVMVAVGLGAIWAGGLVFTLVIALCCGGMVWELSQMLAPRRSGTALQLGFATAGAVFLATFLPIWLGVTLLLVPVVQGWVLVSKPAKLRFAFFALWVGLAGYSFVWMRLSLGADWLIWLAVVVVATDVAGYFAGKTFGGAKVLAAHQPEKDLVRHLCGLDRRCAGWRWGGAPIRYGICYGLGLGTGFDGQSGGGCGGKRFEAPDWGQGLQRAYSWAWWVVGSL